jgi:phage tail-like protein
LSSWFGPAATDVPFTGQFKLEVDDVELGRFMECKGLVVELEIEEIQEGGENQFVHKLPKGLKWPNITLKRGVTETNDLFEWMEESSGIKFSANGSRLRRRTGRVSLVNAAGETLRTWEFDGAIPVKWTGPEFNASTNAVATETLEIAHHGFKTT